jgi:hypothetical protein
MLLPNWDIQSTFLLGKISKLLGFRKKSNIFFGKVGHCKGGLFWFFKSTPGSCAYPKVNQSQTQWLQNLLA